MTTLPMTTGLLIDGEWIAGSGTLPAIDSSDLSVIAEVARRRG